MEPDVRTSDPTEEEVDEVHAEYCKQLKQLFDTYKSKYGAGEEAESKKTSYIVLAVSLAVTSAMGYAVYQLVGMGKLGQSFGSLMLA